MAFRYTASELYAKCLAGRLQAWSLEHGVPSHCRKGILPFDSVFEQNYVFQRRLDDARTGGPDLCAEMLDFTNAYGSVPHQVLLGALQGAEAGDIFHHSGAKLSEQPVCCIASAFKLLTTADRELRYWAFKDRHSLIAVHLKRNLVQVDVEVYLNGDFEGDFRAPAL
ncbi:hypothetical protein HPB50_027724 [Hyalomma asiaticum]|nr:hypothetical protein HPB50_027724 [Hyalomma asiaticum]